jgi:DNA-binding NtrC family response regulator
MKILLIDDEEFVRLALTGALQAEGCHVTSAGGGKAGLDALRTASFDCVVTDLRMPGTDGLAVLRWIRDHQPDTDVILLTGHSDVAAAVEAMKAGAWDFLIKDIPFNPASVAATLAKLKAVRALRRENASLRREASHRAEPTIDGTSPAWQTLLDTVKKIASSQAPVLIQGETGVGKELIARKLHELSPRHDAPFLAVNCGAIAGELLESELFGHEKGSFTGATAATTGLIAAAEGGTLFLDEIGEMSGAMQVSLLRVLDRGEYRQVGGTRALQADVRFLAASNRDLQELVLVGKFRDDLLYRINTITLKVPSLRERPDDIPQLAEHFLRTLSHHGGTQRTFSRDALKLLTSYAWPGNVRELRNVIERLVLLSPPDQHESIDVEELGVLLQPIRPPGRQDAPAGSLEETEKTHILRVLTEQQGNKTRTARLLGIDYKTLLTKLKKYGAS